MAQKKGPIRSSRERKAVRQWMGGAAVEDYLDAAQGSGRAKRDLTEEEFELYCLTPEALFTDYDEDAVSLFGLLLQEGNQY